MKRILSNKKTTIIIFLVVIIVIAFYTYMLARPISYGMGYHNKTAFEGGIFEGTMTFHIGGDMGNNNTNLGGEMKSRYYYKDGYIFFTMSETDAEYAEEVAYINENFEEAIELSFYSAKTNAFRMMVKGGDDGYESVYSCGGAVLFAVAFGIFELILIAVTAASFVISQKYKKTNNNEEIEGD